METNNAPATILIHNARIVNEGDITTGWILVRGCLIEALGHGEKPCGLTAELVIDARNRLLLPGVIDTHVHFRDPGLTHKADMATESHAAAAGGVTSFIDMPNTKPATVTAEALEQKKQRAAEVATANYGFFIGATNDNLPTLLSTDYTECAGVKLFLGSSTGNMLVNDDSVIKRIFSEVPALIAVHAEDEQLIAQRRQAVIDRYGEQLEIAFHPVIRNHEVCRRATEQAVNLAKATGARLHVCHISTADELQYFSPGPVEKKRITAETCPQYLIFTDEAYPALGARIKCNPAIKRPEDRDALRRAVADGIIDSIATDHAPHLPEEKQGTALTAVSGMPMIQFSLPVMLQMCSEHEFTVERIVQEMCHNPALIYGIQNRGFIRPGYYADLVIADDDCEPYTITPDWVVSRCGWSPLEGLSLNCKVDMTILNGRIVYSHGTVFSSVKGLPLRFEERK